MPLTPKRNTKNVCGFLLPPNISPIKQGKSPDLGSLYSLTFPVSQWIFRFRPPYSSGGCSGLTRFLIKSCDTLFQTHYSVQSQI